MHPLAETFCEACQSTHSLKRGCRCARCGCGMHPLFIVCVSGLKGEKLAWCPACDEMLQRARDPRVGDRIITLDGLVEVEIKDVCDDESGVFYTHTETGSERHFRFLYIYQAYVTKAIKGGQTFHAVEDDEE